FVPALLYHFPVSTPLRRFPDFSMNELYFMILLAALVVIGILQLILLLRVRNTNTDDRLVTLQTALQHGLQQSDDRLERELREQVQSTAQATRQELGSNFSQFQQALTTQLTSVAT